MKCNVLYLFFMISSLYVTTTFASHKNLSEDEKVIVRQQIVKLRKASHQATTKYQQLCGRQGLTDEQFLQQFNNIAGELSGRRDDFLMDTENSEKILAIHRQEQAICCCRCLFCFCGSFYIVGNNYERAQINVIEAIAYAEQDL